ncbi:helix-turn-helix domain-containing protein [Calidifontibacter indicus]|uniref:Excisionase family DNA binding protein n=1 Tax=Calidifontibacter indicus TaxID=419650 RepID=A0A3D9UKE6_9MICO|nr:helix-turn-helix domain-containing protein [Calidifontibacter indicus]REF29932.1 excisionase family DNA binding protein [Calidifontibacter indicus]
MPTPTKTAARHSATYLPSSEDEASAASLAKVLQVGDDGLAALVAPDGTTIALSAQVHRVLVQVADAMAHGMGVTVAPHNAMLTTQEAADFLGISRPTLVRIIDRGDLEAVKPGRHRYVALQDLIAYQERVAVQRRKSLDEMARDAESAGLYDLLDGQPPLKRH